MTDPRRSRTRKDGPYRILQLHGTFEQGGKEARVVRLMNEWAGKLSHDILIGDPSRDGARAGIDPGVETRFLGRPALTGSPGFAKLHALARFMRGYDLILSFNWGAMDGVMAHRLFGAIKRLPPLIHHEDGFNADEALARNPVRNRYRRIALQRAHALVVPSGTLAHIAAEEWRQPSGRVHQIPNGIDVAAFAGQRGRDSITGLGADDRLIVGTLAGLRPVKNLARLIRAVAPLRDRVRLVIVGEGPERSKLAEEARTLGVDLLMPGHMTRPQTFVGAFDIFALSSDSEQFPIALVEAMAAGLPAVSTDVGDVAAIVSSNNRPFVVAPGNEAAYAAALARLAGDADLRAQIGAANRQRAVHCFDSAVMIDHYARLYGDALGSETALL